MDISASDMKKSSPPINGMIKCIAWSLGGLQNNKTMSAMNRDDSGLLPEAYYTMLNR